MHARARARTLTRAIAGAALASALAAPAEATQEEQARGVLETWALERAWVCTEIVRALGYGRDTERIMHCMAALAAGWNAAAQRRVRRRRRPGGNRRGRAGAR